MKRFSTLQFMFSFVLFFVIFSSVPTFSQIIKEEVTEGKDYWLGIPHCKRETGEAIRGDFPMALWISSKVNTVATVEDAETGTKQNVVIMANQIKQVPMGDNVMNKVSEEPRNFGIHVTARDPISVAVYLSYRWSGEAYRVIPVEWLGKKYVTLNLYLDKTDEYKPAQILIIATENNTKVKYRPTAKTFKSEKGVTNSIVLQKGQTFLIEGATEPTLVQDNSTDLTGTWIEADKPIGVISGHTKGAFPRYQSTMLGRPGNFMRNMMVDMMWPVELLGKEYISAPVKYDNRPRGVSPDDKGDMIRFVACEDNTILYQMRTDGTGLMKIGRTLKKGDWHEITNQEIPAYYKSNNPVLVGQYGKTWWDHQVTPIVNGKGDNSQNPSRNGQGMLIVLAPMEHWCSYATFKAPEGIDNYVYVTFEADKLNKLKFDGMTFAAKFGTAINYIKGTKYAYLTEQISAGDHFIEGLDLDDGLSKATFAGYCYGNWDRSKDGFAYGYPVGMNYSIPCEDSLAMDHEIVCGNVTGNAYALPPNSPCAEILTMSMISDRSFNYDFIFDKIGNPSKKATFAITLIDPRKPAKAVFYVMSKSGKVLRDSVEYFPELIKIDPVVVDYGVLQVGDRVCKNIKITNIGQIPVKIDSMSLQGDYPAKFELPKDLPYTLAIGESHNFEFCAIADEQFDASIIVKADVKAFMACFDSVIATLKYKMGDPAVWIGDATWKDIPVGVLKSKQVEIVNKSNVEVILNSIQWNDSLHFPKVEGLTFPLRLAAKASTTFTAFYIPDVPNATNTETAYFTGNTDKDKLNSVWIGNGIQAGPYIEGYDWQRRRVIDKYNDSTQYKWSVMIDNTSISGTRLDVTDVVVNDPDNVFSINRGDIPVQLNPKEPRYITAFFSPKAEKAYQVEVTLKSKFNNEPQEVSGLLIGIGELPHINVEDHDFRPKIQVNDSRQGIVVISNHTNVNPMELTIKEISIDGPDKASFVIDPAWLAGNPMPIKIPVDGTISVPVKFTALHGGIHNARIVTKNDAPDPGEPLAFNDKPTGDLIGEGFSEGIVTTDYDFQTIFRTTTKTGGKVYLQNNGTDPITINNDIRTGIVDNANGYIKVDRWYTEQGGLVNPAAGFELGAGDKLWVETTYSPAKEGSHSIQIVYDYNDGQKAISNVIGKANLIRTIARIPKDKYISTLTDLTPIEIEFMIDRPASTIEDKPLEQAAIKSFIARVHFNSLVNRDTKVQDVYPLVNGPADIKLTTMTGGWTCESATIVDNRILEVKMTSNEALKLNTDSEVLFKFNMSCYLSDLDVVPLPCEFIPLGAPAGYVVVDTIPGNIKVNPVCVNTLRLIKFIDGVSSLMTNTPNPVTDKTTIQYQVGEKGPVSIMLYDNLGNKIATLIDQQQDKGLYTFVLDVNQLSLPAGVYIYKLTCGGQTDSKTMVVTK